MSELGKEQIIDERNLAFEEIYKKYESVLRTTAKRYRVPPCDVEDLIQETYLSFILNYSMDWPDERKRAVLIKILKNRCIDYFRYKREDFGLEEVNEMRTYNASDDPEYKILEKESDREFRKEIYKLKREYKDIILLHGLMEKDTITICRQLGISKNAYYSRLYRTKKCLITICISRGTIKITMVFL